MPMPKKPDTLPDKRVLLAAVIDALAETRTMMAAAADDSRRGATHPESRAEGSKDMRSTEQSYLARGQAMRVEELDEHIKRLRYFEPGPYGAESEITVGALVVLEDAEGDAEPRLVFLLPHGGGTEVVVAGQRVTVVTGTSPLGKALIGRYLGDDIELRTQTGKKEQSIVRVV
jgi:transcription elongation GreA/GreB family factor